MQYKIRNVGNPKSPYLLVRARSLVKVLGFLLFPLVPELLLSDLTMDLVPWTNPDILRIDRLIIFYDYMGGGILMTKIENKDNETPLMQVIAKFIILMIFIIYFQNYSKINN